MAEDFPLNRFDFSNLAKSIQECELLPEVITDSETEIEFYGGNTVSREKLVHFLENFNELDNLAQNDSKKEYEKHAEFGVESYQFEPWWVEISPAKATVGYVGTYVNTNFDITFLRVNGKWIMDQ